MFFFLQFVILFHSALMMTNHPLMMGLMLMLTSVMYGLMSYFMVITPWVSYILIMVFVSGAMIMFIYMASLSSNENMKMSFLWLTLMIIVSETTLLLIMKTKPKQVSLGFSLNENLQPMESMITIYKTYNSMMMDLTVIMVSYLLIVLIVAMKIISFNKGPLRT